MDLDNREIAFLTWFALIAGAIVWKTRRSEALHNLLRLLLTRPLLCLFVAIACYVAACVWLLSVPGWWLWSNLKTTLAWTVGFALAATFNYEKVESGRSYFRATIIEAIGITAFLSFISSSHTFGLFTELAIALILIVLVVLSALSERDSKLKPVNSLSTVLLIMLSLLMLGNSIYHIVSSFGDFATSFTARELALPVLLTIMFLPFLYGLYIYSTYERVLDSFHFSIKDPTLRRYARRKLPLKFRLDTAGLEKWRRHVVMFTPESTAQIDGFIEEIKLARRREKRPYRVPPQRGWLPDQAKSFLTSEDLTAGDYHRTHEGWWAQSQHLQIGSKFPHDNIVYSIEGDEFVVSRLKLQLNVKTATSVERSYERFSLITSLLVNSAIPAALKSGNDMSISSDGRPLFVGGYKLTMTRNNWPNSTTRGHDLVLAIEIAVPDTPPTA